MADEYYQFLSSLRAMVVLIQYRHITGTWRDCIGHKQRPASNSIFSFRLGEVKLVPHVSTVTEKYTNSCDCLNLLAHWIVICPKLYQRGLKLSTETLLKSGLAQRGGKH